MRKKVFLIISLLILLTAYTLLLTGCKKTDISNESNVKVTFVYGDTSINEILSDEDGERIKSILDSKTLYTDSPSCGFSENISILIGDKVYCIARDSCGIVQIGEKYISLNNEENKEIRKILSDYGFVFPCV